MDDRLADETVRIGRAAPRHLPTTGPEMFGQERPPAAQSSTSTEAVYRGLTSTGQGTPSREDQVDSEQAARPNAAPGPARAVDPGRQPGIDRPGARLPDRRTGPRAPDELAGHAEQSGPAASREEAAESRPSSRSW